MLGRQNRSSAMGMVMAVVMMFMMTIGVPSVSFAAGAPAKSASLSRLDVDAIQLNADMMALHTRLQDIHKVLWTTKKLLAAPGILASDLKKLETELKLLDGLLNTAQAVPQFREDAKKAKQQIDVVLKEVSAARARAEDLEHRVEPYKPKIESADNKVQKIDTNAERFRRFFAEPMPTYTKVAQTCVSNAAQDRMSCMQRAVDDKANKLDKGVQEMDKVVKLALTNLPDIVPLKKLDADFEAIDAIGDKVEAMIKRIHEMTGALRELQSLLDKKIGASFPYPDPTWKNPLRVSHYEVKVKMRTILNGAKAIEDEIEHALSKTLWQAAKVFGVGKLVNAIKRDAEKELDGIKKKLHLNQSLRIPELAKLEGAFGNINAALVNFPFDFSLNLPDFSPDAPSLNFGGHFIDLSAIKKLMNELAPNGLSGAPAKICTGVSYGCTAGSASSAAPAPQATRAAAGSSVSASTQPAAASTPPSQNTSTDTPVQAQARFNTSTATTSGHRACFIGGQRLRVKAGGAVRNTLSLVLRRPEQAAAVKSGWESPSVH